MSVDYTGPHPEILDRIATEWEQRGPVHATYLRYIGKEANQLEEVESGLVHDWEEAQTEYKDARLDPWRTIIVPASKLLARSGRTTKEDLAKRTGISARQIQRYWNPKSKRDAAPREEHRAAFTHAVAELLRADMRDREIEPLGDDKAVCAIGLSAYAALPHDRRDSIRPALADVRT